MRTVILRRGLVALFAAAVSFGAIVQAQAAETLRIGYQKYGTLVLLKAKGSLEKRLAAQGVQVQWTEFPGGPQLLEGLNVGAIDFGVTGETPPVFAQAAGADLLYVAYEPPAPTSEAILVPKDSTIKSVAELKGKKIVLNKGSNVHYLLVRALEDAGLKYTDVQTISATRITTRLRIAYIRSILKQEVAYFDICTPGTVSTKISTNANLIQTGISEKVGVTSQGLAMLVSAFAVAFSQQWKLTLVTATTLPGVILFVTISVVLDQKLETKILEVYAKAGSLAEEVLSSMRNVIAFGANDALKKKYQEHLEVIKKYGVQKGPVYGVMYSTEFSVMYCAYALAFWYGIKLYSEGEIKEPGKIVT